MSTMTLQLPSTYVSVEKDEMEYVDGGNAITQWMFSVGTVGTAIDLALGGLAGGGASLIRRYGKAQAEKIFINAVQRVFINIGIKMSGKTYLAISTVADRISSFADIGGMAAKALDSMDASPNNGIVWF